MVKDLQSISIYPIRMSIPMKKWIKKHSDIRPQLFTKEQAILMMADSVEAASRSLKEYTEESISGLVDKIIDSQVQEGYFKECPITFKDIATVKVSLKKS